MSVSFVLPDQHLDNPTEREEMFHFGSGFQRFPSQTTGSVVWESSEAAHHSEEWVIGKTVYLIVASRSTRPEDLASDTVNRKQL